MICSLHGSTSSRLSAADPGGALPTDAKLLGIRIAGALDSARFKTDGGLFYVMRAKVSVHANRWILPRPFIALDSMPSPWLPGYVATGLQAWTSRAKDAPWHRTANCRGNGDFTQASRGLAHQVLPGAQEVSDGALDFPLPRAFLSRGSSRHFLLDGRWWLPNQKLEVKDVSMPSPI